MRTRESGAIFRVRVQVLKEDADINFLEKKFTKLQTMVYFAGIGISGIPEE